MRSRKDARPRGLVDEVVSSHRFTALALVAMLVLSMVTSGYLLLVTQPRLTSTIMLTKSARDAHQAMLDQETGVRGWLATEDEVFLEPYTVGKQAADANFDQMVSQAEWSPQLTGDVVETLLAQARWQVWAERAARRSFTVAERTDGALRDFLLKGKSLFDAYRVAETVSLGRIQDLRDEALADQGQALQLTLASYLTLLLLAGGLFLRRRRETNSRILVPVRNLLETIGELQRGDLTARTQTTDVPELREVGTQIDRLAEALAVAQVEAAQREARLALMAARFETVVRVGREISGSLSVRYVAATFTTAASDLLATSATLWVRGEDQSFHVANRNEGPYGAPGSSRPPSELRAPDLVSRAAAEARVVTGADHRAYPLVLAGTVTGVLEVGDADPDRDAEQVLDALLSAAAAALESAHLHSTARELADVDALTRLPNRRRLELDIDEEWDRCRRYGRPLSLVMLDLDHFKDLNDAHGHLVGDEVLRLVADALGATLRNTDTAYRYGGEELVVLLRETGLEDAVQCAERMRAEVAGITVEGRPLVQVTASAGVGSRRSQMTHHSELVARADAALYEAKRQGRNRVQSAEDLDPRITATAPRSPDRRQGAPSNRTDPDLAAPAVLMPRTPVA